MNHKFINYFKSGLAKTIITQFFSFGIIPLCILSMIFLVFSIQSKKQDLMNIEKEIVDRIALGINAQLEKTTGQIRFYAHTLSLENNSPKMLSISADDFLNQSDEYDEVTITDTRGNEICKASRYYTFRNFELTNISKNESFKRAKEGKIHLSSIEISRYSKFPSIQITVPATDYKNQIRGVVSVTVNVSKMWKLISKYNIGNTRYAYVVDAKGTLIISPDISGILQKQNLAHMENVKKLLEGTPGVYEYVSLNGNKVIGSSALIPITNWGVIVEEPIAEAYRHINFLSIVFVAILLGTVALAVFLGLLFSYRNIINPLKRLQKETKNIAAGEFSRPIDMSGRTDELGQLSAAFNSMIGELRETTVSRDILIKEIEEKNRIEKALVESENRYRTIFENTGSAIAILEKDASISLVNKKMQELVGSQTGATGKRKWMEFIHPDDLPMMQEYHSMRMKDTGSAPSAYGFRMIDNAGKTKYVFMNIALFPGTTQLVCNLTDITELKLAEEALKKSEEKYRNIFENSMEGIFQVTVDGKFISANPALAQIGGYASPGEMIGGISDVGSYFYADQDERRNLMDKLIHNGFIEKYEIRGYRKDKNIIWLSLSARVIRDQKGKIIYIEGTAQDITDRKKLEHQLLQAQKMEAIGTLAGGIAHDFNNLLMGMQGYASLLLHNIDKEHAHYQKLLRLEELIKNGADLTKQLLGFARKGKYEVKPVNLNEIIKKTAAMFGQTRKEITIEERYRNDLWVTEVDALQIEQVMINLYVNAWQAMPEGGQLFIESDNVSVRGDDERCNYLQPGNYVKISVTDTGLGMDEKTRERIFEPFFTTKEMGRGTGLGLATVYGIIKSHGGTIEVQSEKASGSTFSIYLPSSSKEVFIEKEQMKKIPLGQERVLLVDDEDMIVNVTREMLEKLGYRVTVAKTGQEAVDIYKTTKNELDIVILDMVMPGMGGAEVFDILKSINPQVKIILSSGYSIDGMASKIMERGCKSFIQKPFSMTELSLKVRHVLDED